MAEEPPTKKVRQGDDLVANETSNYSILSENGKVERDSHSSLSILSPSIISSASKFAKSYSEAKPYPHNVIPDLFVNGFLEQVLEEIKHDSKVKFKESDLFRVWQSVDLRNLDESDSSTIANLPSLLKLRQLLYSSSFRSFMESISNLDPGTLTDQVDCAANCHTKGCHLLCHDDVIGTRKISYILYLTDPEPEWLKEDGGSLELYDSALEQNDVSDEGSCGLTRRVPFTYPVKTISPHYNSMAYFAVEPGHSFHSVQEVFCDRPRLSIQGWYHTKELPSKMQDATLQQLKSTEAGADTRAAFTPLLYDTVIDESDNTLSVEDIKFLSKFINKTYLTNSSISEIRTRFEEESSIQLRHFFNDEWASKIMAVTSKEDSEQGLGKGRPALDYMVGTNCDWSILGPVHKQRFLEYNQNTKDRDEGKKMESAGSLLQFLREHVLQSVSFGHLLRCITSLGIPTGYRGKVRRFRPGLDYTIAHYGLITQQSVLDATLCFVAGTGSQADHNPNMEYSIEREQDAIWESGDAGGFECYISAEDEEEVEKGAESKAEDEYDDEDDSKLLSVPASKNTLSLVYRDPGTIRFIKYLSSSAPSSRWDLSLEYQLQNID